MDSIFCKRTVRDTVTVSGSEPEGVRQWRKHIKEGKVGKIIKGSRLKEERRRYFCLRGVKRGGMNETQPGRSREAVQESGPGEKLKRQTVQDRGPSNAPPA